jgi:hypothetical protein
LTALSSMTGIQYLDLSINQLTGVSRLYVVYHCVPRCDLSDGANSALHAWSRVWQLFRFACFVCCVGNLTALSGMTRIQNVYLYNNRLTGVSRLCVVYHCFPRYDLTDRASSALPEWRAMWLLLRFDCFVCCVGNLAALSGLTGMQTLYLYNNHLTGEFRMCVVYHCIPCCDLTAGESSGVPVWHLMWRRWLIVCCVCFSQAL